MKKLRIFATDEESFEDYVKRCAENEEADSIHNASIRHAKIIIEELFKSAIRNGEDIKIVSGRLLNEFYEDLIEPAREVLKHSRIEIIVLDATKEEMQGNDFFRLVNEHDRGSAIVSRIGDANAYQAHFVLVGDRRYRIEIDDGKKDAIASFNNETLGELLLKAFDGYRSTALQAG